MACKNASEEGRHKNHPLCKVREVGVARFLRAHLQAGEAQRKPNEATFHEAGGNKNQATSAVRAARQILTTTMDQWIVRNYHPSNRHDWAYGSGQMKKMVKAFDAEFSTRGTRPNQIIGRWNRLRKDGVVPKQVRQVPSLPRLKFMEGPNV